MRIHVQEELKAERAKRWRAWADGRGMGDTEQGFGPTREAAVADLKRQLGEEAK